jgi:hypothetical protein
MISAESSKAMVAEQEMRGLHFWLRRILATMNHDSVPRLL